ncbi:MAG: haloacid dehalogenase-like hydrolase [Clostridia bacterium]|nr:haloacid dehalogenase-like hydrolase [Clostridia bacterium]
MAKQHIVALLYDFDKTLCTRDMQEYTFIPSLGMEPDEFWGAAGVVAEKELMDSVLAYMYCMIDESNKRGIPFSRETLLECGKHIVYHPGVKEWFERINEYGRQAGVQVEHYVLSSGLKEIIDGCEIAKYFKKIFASEFMYNEQGRAIWPKMAVNYTNKTQFVYRINKGVLDINNNVDLNKSQPDDDRRVFFRNMVYIGDGLTDVPCMKLVKQSGGHSIALYHEEEKSKVQPLLQHERVDWIFEADFREGGALDDAVHTLISQLGCKNKLQDVTDGQKKEIK